MCMICFGVTTENSAKCVFFLIRYGDSFYWLLWLLFFCDLLSTLNAESANLLFPWTYPTMPQSQLCSILTDGQWRLWLFLLSSVVSSGHRQVHTTKYSAKILSPISKLSMTVANGFSVLLCSSHSGQLHWHRLLSLSRHRLLGYSWNPEAYKAFLVFVSRLP